MDFFEEGEKKNHEKNTKLEESLWDCGWLCVFDFDSIFLIEFQIKFAQMEK